MCPTLRMPDGTAMVDNTCDGHARDLVTGADAVPDTGLVTMRGTTGRRTGWPTTQYGAGPGNMTGETMEAHGDIDTSRAFRFAGRA